MKIVALLVNLLGIPALLVGAWAAMFSPMFMGAPGSTESTGLWVAMYAVWAFPLLVILGEIFGWIYFVKGNYKAAIGAYKWAVLDILLIVVALLLVGK
ncbi:MAG: hypothetical protein ACKVTZ_09715 [Bacteroidia bacterium]